MNILKSKFMQDQKGAFLPLFAIGSLVLIPVIGLSIDYTRLMSFKGKVQSAADTAVAAAVIDGRDGKKAESTAKNFLAANLPGVEFESRRVLSDGKIVFQVRSVIETPLLAMVGKPRFTVYTSTDMPLMEVGNQGAVSAVVYSDRDIRLMKRNISAALRKFPKSQRAAYMKEYDAFFARANRSKFNIGVRSK